MTSLAFGVAGTVVILGVAFVLLPDNLIATRRDYLVGVAGLSGEAAFRVGIGLILMLAARRSRLPREIRAIGAVVVVVGLATPFLGVAAAQSRLDWEAAHVPFLRVEGTLFVCLGIIIASAFMPLHTADVADQGAATDTAGLGGFP